MILLQLFLVFGVLWHRYIEVANSGELMHQGVALDG